MTPLSQYVNEGLFGNSFSKCMLYIWFKCDIHEKIPGLRPNDTEETAEREAPKFYKFFEDNVSNIAKVTMCEKDSFYNGPCFYIRCELSKLKKLKPFFMKASREFRDAQFHENCVSRIDIKVDKKSKDNVEKIKKALSAVFNDSSDYRVDNGVNDMPDYEASLTFLGKNKVNCGFTDASWNLGKILKLYEDGFKVKSKK